MYNCNILSVLARNDIFSYALSDINILSIL
jgi:hypothetical protein